MTPFNDEISRKSLIDADDRARVRNGEATHVRLATDMPPRGYTHTHTHIHPPPPPPPTQPPVALVISRNFHSDVSVPLWLRL